jgi:uncharacterized protein (TIGR02646 family)
MIRVQVDPTRMNGPDADAWTRWSKRAAAATQEVVARVAGGDDPEFSSAVWTDLKPFLLRWFHDKCAYCESKMTDVSAGTVDHYRPKGRVAVKKDSKVSVVRARGYYWLAYDWRNLLPVCERCNSGGGKNDQFPTAKPLADDPKLDPDALDAREKPLLLNPLVDDPERHLRFGVKGVVVGLDERGNATVAAYNLGRQPLSDSRDRTAQQAVLGAMAAFGLIAAGNAVSADSIARYVGPDAEHSAAARAAIDAALEQMRRALAVPGLPPLKAKPPQGVPQQGASAGG